MARTHRVTIPLTGELKQWYDETAKQLGLTTTALILMSLNQVKEGTEKAKQHFIEHNVLPSLNEIL